jgi:hypothetical protein
MIGLKIHWSKHVQELDLIPKLKHIINTSKALTHLMRMIILAHRRSTHIHTTLSRRPPDGRSNSTHLRHSRVIRLIAPPTRVCDLTRPICSAQLAHWRDHSCICASRRKWLHAVPSIIQFGIITRWVIRNWGRIGSRLSRWLVLLRCRASHFLGGKSPLHTDSLVSAFCWRWEYRRWFRITSHLWYLVVILVCN